MHYKIKMFVPICLDSGIFLFGARTLNTRPFALKHSLKTRTMSEQRKLSSNTYALYILLFLSLSCWFQFSLHWHLKKSILHLCKQISESPSKCMKTRAAVLHITMRSPICLLDFFFVNKRDWSLFCMIMCCTINSHTWLSIIVVMVYNIWESVFECLMNSWAHRW